MANKGLYELTDTWNAGGTTFTGIGQDITDTASAADSKVLDQKIGGTSVHAVRKDGLQVAGGMPYGVLCVQAGSTGEATVDATPRKIAAWNTDGVEAGVTVDHTSDDMTIDVAGTYLVTLAASFSGSGNDDYQLEIYKNAGATGFAVDRKLGTGGDVGSCSIMGIVNFAATDTVSVYQSSSSGGTAMTVTEAQLGIVRIGD
ncbi:MAG: hypothetical protein GY952_14075 [Rhodobacteraceae bacterium]|nr:hypothetical protein [Paracoccaceae bacterium]